MSQHPSTLLALAAVAALSAGVAEACPVSIAPPVGSAISSSTPIVFQGWPIPGLAERGPALWSPEDVVDLRVVESRDRYAVLVPTRPLHAGTTYTFALTRNQIGHGLPRAEIPLRFVRWTGAGAPAALCCARYWIHYSSAHTHPFARLAEFGLLPFLLSYGLTATFLARRRRRILASLLG